MNRSSSATLMAEASAAMARMEFDIALNRYLQAAGQGSAEGALSAAAMYEKGIGVRADSGRARQLYRQAARAGHPTAQAHLQREYREDLQGAAGLLVISIVVFTFISIFYGGKPISSLLLAFTALILFAGLVSISFVVIRSAQILFFQSLYSYCVRKLPALT